MNHDPIETGALSVRAAAEMAAGYAALHTLADLLGAERVHACLGRAQPAIIAGAIGAAVVDALSLSGPTAATSRSGVPLTRSRT